MITQKKTLKKWFSNFMKPAQEHFAAWIDSYWHKSEQIPMSSIDGLSKAIENTASAKQLLNHLEDSNAHRNLFDKKVDKEEGKGLSANDFTNEHKQKLEELQPTDVSGLLPKGGYDGTGQQLKEAIDGLQTKMQQVETTLSVDDTDFDTLQEIAAQVKNNKNLEQLLIGKVDKKDSLWSSIKEAIYFYNLPNKTNKGVRFDGECVEIFAESLVNIRNRGGVNITGANGQRGEYLIVSEETVDINSETTSIRAKNLQQSSEEYSHAGKKMDIYAEELSIRANKLLVNGKDLSSKLNSLGDFNAEEINRKIEAIENTLMNAGYIIQQP
ncbi:hypothetical protein C8P65_102154 [Capnocytophaga leadbetteri]|uniref:Uncharacterized protein n=1 Tax=Capnocytophaga leadbetteri TaxID=327575 RepID=A0A2T5XXB2_9FLAO|nr:hypothetical protein [Capnocytophaga leadbetteri]PTX08112.1 hypothetical protein C8P65_102154 [Capnocytophaga leadbetteri]